MAIAYDNWTNGGGTFGSLTWAASVTGANPIFIVGYETVGASVVSGITYNAVSMTRVGTEKRVPSGNYGGMFILANASTGTHNAIMTQVGSGSNAAESISFTGTNATGQPDSSTTTSIFGGTSIISNLTTVADNSWLVSWVQNDTTTTSSLLGQIKYSSAGAGRGIFSSNGPVHPAGVASIGATFATTSVLATAISIAPVAPPVNVPFINTRFFQIMGAGT